MSENTKPRGCGQREVIGHGQNHFCGDELWGEVVYCDSCNLKAAKARIAELEAALDAMGGKQPEAQAGVAKATAAKDAQIEALRAEVERLRTDLMEFDEIREKLGRLLTRTAAALKGEPPAGVWHSWHDLPEKAAQLAEALRRYRNEVPLGHQPHMLAHVVDDMLNHTAAQENDDACQLAAIGEEIMVNAAHDVYILPLQPSGLDGQSPRFVVHVPAPEQQPEARIYQCPRCATSMEVDPTAKPEAQAGGAVAWRPMATAPRDGTMLRLLVRFTEHATEDAEVAPTIGAWPADGEPNGAWQFAGWCWTHDHFTEGKGEPIGWLPLLDTAQQPAPVVPEAAAVLSRIARELTPLATKASVQTRLERAERLARELHGVVAMLAAAQQQGADRG